ncbi:uncharacterized protein LOC123649749 [Lemur catta]|uniref:uncharacterized protein LOC123649749 n=1 Tax=Lemur catta TaxID=9447 RepID=UPI001E26D71E|nr:uncharacterized protein LOC123649749 [Lemur catta]
MIIHMLFYDVEADRMPPRSLLLAPEQLSLRPGIENYRDATWARILSLLRKSDKEKDMLLLCQVLHGLATSAQAVLDDASLQEGAMTRAFIKVATKADKTLQISFRHQPLASKSQVAEKALETTGHLCCLLQLSERERLVYSLTGWLTMLTTTPVRPLYICKILLGLLLWDLSSDDIIHSVQVPWYLEILAPVEELAPEPAVKRSKTSMCNDDGLDRP